KQAWVLRRNRRAGVACSHEGRLVRRLAARHPTLPSRALRRLPRHMDPMRELPAPTAFADSAPGGRLGNPAIMPLAPPRGRVDADLPTSLRNVTPKGTRLGLDRRRIARSRRGPWD